MALTRK
jgi:hypothetical protein